MFLNSKSALTLTTTNRNRIRSLLFYETGVHVQEATDNCATEVTVNLLKIYLKNDKFTSNASFEVLVGISGEVASALGEQGFEVSDVKITPGKEILITISWKPNSEETSEKNQYDPLN